MHSNNKGHRINRLMLGNLKRIVLAFYFGCFNLEQHILLLDRCGKKLRDKLGKVGVLLDIPIRHFIRIYSNCDISAESQIGKRLHLPHPCGIIIGKGVTIGDDVTIYQGVTIGLSKGVSGPLHYPKVEDGVIIFSGACIVGNLTLSKECKVGANAFVNINVPAYKTAVGIPARIV